MKSPNSHYKCVFDRFELGFVVCLIWFCFGLENCLVKLGQKCSFMFQPNASSPRRRSALLGKGLHLGEPKTLKFPVFASPRRGLVHIGKGLLHLGELEVLFLLLSFINSRNHQLE